MEAPEKIYLTTDRNNSFVFTQKRSDNKGVEYVRKDAFIKKACGWIKENITNNHSANSVLVRNGCVTLGMLVDDFKKYMED